MDDIEQQRNHFNSIAAKYFHARQDPRHLYLKEAIWKFFFERTDLQHKQNVNVLEAMCGYAEAYTISKKFISSNISFSAFDYSDSMIDYVRTEFPDINAWHQDVTTFCAPNSYDIIYIIGGLHHVHRHARKVFANIAASLVPGGVFINLEPTHNNPIFSTIRKIIYTKNSFFDQETEKAFTTNELHHLGKEHGLEPTVSIYPGLLAYTLWYNPDAFPALNRGTVDFARKIIVLESKLWTSPIARLLSFATLTCFKKHL